MPGMRLILDGDGCWPDLQGKVGTPAVIHTTKDMEVALLSAGMGSGKASVMFRIDLPDGRTVLAETSLALLEACVRAFRARAESTGHA